MVSGVRSSWETLVTKSSLALSSTCSSSWIRTSTARARACASAKSLRARATARTSLGPCRVSARPSGSFFAIRCTTRSSASSGSESSWSSRARARPMRIHDDATSEHDGGRDGEPEPEDRRVGRLPRGVGDGVARRPRGRRRPGTSSAWPCATVSGGTPSAPPGPDITGSEYSSTQRSTACSSARDRVLDARETPAAASRSRAAEAS